MRVLLVGVGEFFHVGAFFRNALDALGHEYTFVDESAYLRPLARSRFHKLAYRLLGKRPLTSWKFNSDIVKCAKKFRPETVLITSGRHVFPQTLAEIKAETGAVLVNYATDDPFNPVNSTADLLGGIRFYDLYACTKRAIMADVRRAGCPNVCYVPFGYEPSLHFPEPSGPPQERHRFESDVVFIGGADADRWPYFEALVGGMPNLQLHLYGGYWDRCHRLKPFHRGFALGRDYRLAVGGGKISPCLVRKANRDGHAMRTFEIPACAGFLLAERTEEHLEFFKEGAEADFFGSPEEMTDKIKYYLGHESERLRMARAAYAKVTGGGCTYRDRLQEILGEGARLRSQVAEVCHVG